VSSKLSLRHPKRREHLFFASDSLHEDGAFREPAVATGGNGGKCSGG
jgi:hypothetical protein